MRTIQVLVPTMELKDPENLLKKLNINSQFIVANQTNDHNSVTTRPYSYGDYRGLIISRNDIGVGNNRNILLKYASEDICLMADDDMTFVDDYSSIVNNTFDRIKDADVVVFNLGNAGNRRQTIKTKRLNQFNYMNYGAARLGFLRKSISYHGIFFNTNFGGGTNHSAGEDVLFIGECIKKGLHVYAVPESIASLRDDRESTWFKGYTDKYLFDKGVFLAISNPKMARLYALYLAYKHSEYVEKRNNKTQVLKTILNGIRFIVDREYLK